ncbi:MAG: hypothetical protein Q4Q33_02010 [Eubacteriales bacterium]|nr:hypothetical protein [Eubacteriales bacterium]
MKKRDVLLLTVVMMIGSTLNVYGETFNTQSPGKNVLIIETEDNYEEAYKFIRFDGNSMFNAIDISQAKKLMGPEK